MKVPFLTYFKRFDLFGNGVSFTFDGQSSYQSVCGAILTIISTTLALIFFNEKYLIFIDKEDTNYQEWVEFGANSANQNPIGYKETGYNFAFSVAPLDFAIRDWKPDPEMLDYLEIGIF